MYGICNLSLVPCRREPSDKSEMVTQLLFGEYFEILEEKGSWARIRISDDLYEAWIDRKQFLTLSESCFLALKKAPRCFAFDLVQALAHNTTGNVFPVVIGSILPFYDNCACFLEEEKYTYEGTTIMAPDKPLKSLITQNAYLFLNTPYLWGGRSPFGIDCSGFTQMVYKLGGINLKRDAYQQAEAGTALSFVEEAEPGDLAFFDNEEGRIIHVGIILVENKIIHASGKVRIDQLDHYGIYNRDLGKYSHRLRVIKKIIY